MSTKTVFLTGASRGIGFAIAEKLKREGYNLIAPTRAELNLLDDNSIQNFAEKYKDSSIDAIVNCAGINKIDLIEEISDKDINNIVKVNLIAPLKLIQGLVGYMKKNKSGRIVNISSIWSVVSKEKRTVYSASKYGISGITKSLAVELGPYNILVNSVSPGYTDTEMSKQNITPAERIEIKKIVPLGRFALPKEIAELVEFLISDRNTYLTGQNIVIDGGYTSR